MIVAVATDGYVEAADAFRTGNHAAADVHARLVSGLSTTGAMAGDDASAADIATAYDQAAAGNLAAIGDVVTAYSTLRRVTTDSAINHQRAEERSILPGGVVPMDCTPSPPGTDRTVLSATPPTSLGGDAPILTPEERWILDHIEGFVWPDAEVDRLRNAARTWRAAAAGLDDVASYCAIAVAALDSQRSPEIPLARAATAHLRTTISALATSCDALAADCDAYADAVESRRTEIRSLLHEILRFVIEGVVIGAALSAVTAGVGSAVALSSIAARVAAQSPRFAVVLAALRATTSAVAESVRSTHATVQLHRVRLERFLRVPARNERGALALGRPGRPPGWLSRHEHSGSHTIRAHVGRARHQLWARFGEIPRPPLSSTFRTQEEAEQILDSLMRKRQGAIDQWLADDGRRLILEGRSRMPTGVSMHPSGETQMSHGVRVVLERDATMPEGFRIFTAFPQP